MKCLKREWTKQEALINNIGGEEGVTKLLKGELDEISKARIFITLVVRMIVNYNLSIKEMVKHYVWISNDITDNNFPSSEIGKAEASFALFHFRRYMNSKDVIFEMEKAGYRPATMKELLLFGKKNPALQRKFKVIALGSVFKKGHELLVGHLSECINVTEHIYGNSVYLTGQGKHWAIKRRFLAVSK